tara:strand:+ start:314 stop:1171 length:858 start_codon:yes stop_codon:yes gene_type:complete
MGKKNRKAGDKLKDYDLAATGAGSKKGTERFSKSDAKSLLKEGKGIRQLQKYGEGLDEEGGQIYGGRAQKFLDKKLARKKARKANQPEKEQETTTPPENKSPAPTPTPTQPTPTQPAPSQPTPTPAPTPTQPAPGQPAPPSNSTQPASSPTEFRSNVETTRNPVLAAENLTKPREGFVEDTTTQNEANASISDRYKQSGEQQYNFSQNTLSGTSRSAQAVAQAADLTNSAGREMALRQSVTDSITGLEDSSKIKQLGLFGDIYNMETPTWTSFEKPKKIEADLGD